MHKIILFMGLLFAVSLSTQAGEWRSLKPGDMVRVPADFFYQEGYRVQWWYFTGHLFTEAGRQFGYELALFAAAVQKSEYQSKFAVRSLYLAHAAVSDLDEKRFYQAAHGDSGAYGFAGADSERLNVWVDRNILEGTPDRMHIRGQAANAAFDLVLLPNKPLVLNGQQGYSRKSEESPEIASLYFSYTDLKTTGTLKIGSSEYRVAGTSWFDRELFSRGLGQNQAGWDWFALQLDDGREIMLYRLRKKDGSVDRWSSGTVSERTGKFRNLVASDFDIKPRTFYRSKHTGIRYPSAWRIEVPAEAVDITVTPLMEDQEFLAPGVTGNAYWEGACRIEGSVRGRAYAELTGY